MVEQRSFFKNFKLFMKMKLTKDGWQIHSGRARRFRHAVLNASPAYYRFFGPVSPDWDFARPECLENRLLSLFGSVQCLSRINSPPLVGIQKFCVFISSGAEFTSQIE